MCIQQRLFTLLLMVSILSSKAETNPVDSLRQIWTNIELADSSRLKAIDELSWLLAFQKPEESIVLCREYLSLAQRSNDTVYIAKALNTIGICYYVQSDYLNALHYFRQSATLRSKMGDKIGLANVWNNMVSIYSSRGKYVQALELLSKARTVYDELRDTMGIAGALNNIGIIYQKQSLLEKAISNYEEAMDMYLKIKHYSGYSQVSSNAIACYANLENYTDAISLSYRNISYLKTSEDRYNLAIAFNNLGAVYHKMKHADSALSYFTLGYQIHQELNNKAGMSGSLYHLGQIQLDLKNYSSAERYCLQSLKISEEIGSLADKEQACLCLYNTYKGLENPAKALHFYEAYTANSDSLAQLETSTKLSQLEFDRALYKDSVQQAKKAFDTELKHQAEIRAKNKARNILFLILAIIGVGLVVVWGRLSLVRRSRSLIEKEKERSENLLLNILPADIANELKDKGESEARNLSNVSVLFTDFKGFTQVSEILSATELVNELNTCFKQFDVIMAKYNIEKIKTIGDAYMAAAGLNNQSPTNAIAIVKAALEMQAFIIERNAQLPPATRFTMRLGIHTGDVVAGIVGLNKFQYDIWGDTVNTAARMESSGEINTVNISETTYQLVKDYPEFSFLSRGEIEAKNKGKLNMYFVCLNA